MNLASKSRELAMHLAVFGFQILEGVGASRVTLPHGASFVSAGPDTEINTYEALRAAQFYLGVSGPNLHVGRGHFLGVAHWDPGYVTIQQKYSRIGTFENHKRDEEGVDPLGVTQEVET